MSIKIENTQVFGWEGAIRGARNPMNSWEKSDSLWFDGEEYYDICGNSGPAPKESNGTGFDIGYSDHKLLMNLCKGGTEEAKWRRMIHVQMDITAPLYWWKEFETYKVGTVSNSCSTMHKIHTKEFTLDDFSCEHLIASPYSEHSTIKEDDIPDFDKAHSDDMANWNTHRAELEQELGPNYFIEHPEESILDLLPPIPDDAFNREYDWLMEHGAYEIEVYNVNPEHYDDQAVGKFALDVLEETIKALNCYREKFLETKNDDLNINGAVFMKGDRKKYWWQMIQLLPSSYNQRRTIDLNYEVLASQYRQRKEHKLDEWRQYCDWIKTLPYSEFITMEQKPLNAKEKAELYEKAIDAVRTYHPME